MSTPRSVICPICRRSIRLPEDIPRSAVCCACGAKIGLMQARLHDIVLRWAAIALLAAGLVTALKSFSSRP